MPMFDKKNPDRTNPRHPAGTPGGKGGQFRMSLNKGIPDHNFPLPGEQKDETTNARPGSIYGSSMPPVRLGDTSKPAEIPVALPENQGLEVVAKLVKDIHANRAGGHIDEVEYKDTLTAVREVLVEKGVNLSELPKSFQADLNPRA